MYGRNYQRRCRRCLRMIPINGVCAPCRIKDEAKRKANEAVNRCIDTTSKKGK